MSDMFPTIAELIGTSLPSDCEINGECLVPFLFAEKSKHRDWIYGYSGADQILRGDLVMRDGRKRWWDVSIELEDLISFAEITDWSQVSDDHRAERDEIRNVLPQFDLHATEHDAPGVELPPIPAKEKLSKGGKK